MLETTNARWEERTVRLGLDPDRHKRPAWRTAIAADIHDLTRMLAAPVLEEQLATRAPSGPDVREASDLILRRATVDHALGIAQISDRDALEEIVTRYREIPLDVHSPGPITVTAQNPLIINSNQSVTNYTTVTIEPGGYIDISVDCLFQAEALVKSTTAPTDGSGQATDIVISGASGTRGADGTKGQDGQAGGGGSDGECDCCGGIAEKNGTDGAAGANGGDGGAAGNGKPGGPGPTVVLSIDDLQSTISLVNIGGIGGDGGNGGQGGAGGNGGNGGSEKTCGAEHCDGGNGGAGANGGNGGNGGNSGDGGPGANVVVHFKTKNGSTMLVTNGSAAPGTPGTGGTPGNAGVGGTSGGRGGSPGANGHTGQNPGKNGSSGVPGSPGQTRVNPSVAG